MRKNVMTAHLSGTSPSLRNLRLKTSLALCIDSKKLKKEILWRLFSLLLSHHDYSLCKHSVEGCCRVNMPRSILIPGD